MSVSGFHLEEATKLTGRPWATSLKSTSSSSARCTVKDPEPRDGRPENPPPPPPPPPPPLLSDMARLHGVADGCRVQWELLRQFAYLSLHAGDGGVVLPREHRVDEVGHLFHLGLGEAARRDGRRPDP